MNELAVARPRTKPGYASPALTARRRVPTARLVERDLRENDTNEPPLRSRHYVTGEWLATDKRQCRYTVREAFPPMPLPSSDTGEGEEAEGELLFFRCPHIRMGFESSVLQPKFSRSV